MLADAADRAQEAIDAAEEEAAEIIKAAEHRAGEIEGRPNGPSSRPGPRGADRGGALQAAEEMRAQAEQDARAVLEEARDATDMIWQEAERERIGVEAETIRLETLGPGRWSSSDGSTGTWSQVLDEVQQASAGSRRSRRTWTRRPPPPPPPARGGAAGELARGESPVPQRPRHRAPRPRRDGAVLSATRPATPAGYRTRRRPRSGPFPPWPTTAPEQPA